MNPIIELGRELRKARLEAGATLKELGEATGLSFGYIGRMERGLIPSPPSEAALESICRALGIDPKPFLSLRATFYKMERAGGQSPIVVPTPVEFPGLASIGQQALEQAHLARQQEQWDAALSLADLACQLCLRSGDSALVGSAQYWLACTHTARSWSKMRIRDFDEQVREDLIAALKGFDRSLEAFARVREPSGEVRQLWYDALAQGARCLERFGLIDPKRIPFSSLGLTDQFPAIFRSAEPHLDAELIKQQYADVRRVVEDLDGAVTEHETREGEGLCDHVADLFAKTILNFICKVYAGALFDRALDEYEQWVETLRQQDLSVAEELELAIAVKNMANVIRDRGMLTPGSSISVECRDLFASIAKRLKDRIPQFPQEDRAALIDKLSEAHQELGFWCVQRDLFEEARWQYYVSEKLGPHTRYPHLSRLVKALSDMGPKEVAEAMKRIEEAEGEHNFAELRYPLFFFNDPPVGEP